MAGAPAVVRINAKASVPVSELLDTFLSKDSATVSEWNQFAGEVQHLDENTQLQTYRMPWPFAVREYLVRCEQSKPPGAKGLQTHCSSIDDHPAAPLRSDRVRGHSETIWRFTPDRDGASSIHLETIVDPRGSLPVKIVDKIGKLVAVKVVRSLIQYTSTRYQAAGKAAGQLAAAAAKTAKASAKAAAKTAKASAKAAAKTAKASAKAAAKSAKAVAAKGGAATAAACAAVGEEEAWLSVLWSQVSNVMGGFVDAPRALLSAVLLAAESGRVNLHLEHLWSAEHVAARDVSI